MNAQIPSRTATVISNNTPPTPYITVNSHPVSQTLLPQPQKSNTAHARQQHPSKNTLSHTHPRRHVTQTNTLTHSLTHSNDAV
ncbi:hypothetical protein BO78DRAFT_233517 [Aspergillus sclerotiicarbonarius CBS 121057]|uniref:Uncharacterized protein n=1 Tax=Aspergillus sclerotiicarbonarius (strain CBS 121057 / IBT 28362) TaxID=1448318 RepID=A0A319EIM3_ASPSB|nr:hypothetical protein BO78DRAFT_233517 [Aspergillus sclerotiicarbonarius CBS 121057]